MRQSDRQLALRNCSAVFRFRLLLRCHQPFRSLHVAGCKSMLATDLCADTRKGT